MEYLGFLVTLDDVKPINKKIEVIKNIVPPSPQKVVRNFIGVINYYHDMWPRQSHMLEPLTKLTPITRKFKCKKVKVDVFEKIKQILTRDNLLTYPDFNGHA